MSAPSSELLVAAAIALAAAAACGSDSRSPLAGAVGAGGLTSGGGNGGRGSAGRPESGGKHSTSRDAGTDGDGANASTRDASDAGGAANDASERDANGNGGRGGTGGIGGMGGIGGIGGEPNDSGSAGAPVCATDLGQEPYTSFGRLGAADATFARFGGVSGDELSVAFTASNGDVYVADRTTKPGAFGPAVKINGNALAVDRAAMDAGGQVVLAVAQDRASLVEFTRTARSGVFSPLAVDDLGLVRAFLAEAGSISEPALGVDRRSLFFLATESGQAPVLAESQWDVVAGAWGPPHSLPNPELASKDAAHARRPTGASSDGRTLFFYDGAGSVERAAWRPSRTEPFDTFLDVGAFTDAAPNPRCDTLYYGGTDGSGSGLFTAG
jgi:hypothetical protein